MAQLLPMSDEMIASFGRADWIARHAMRGLIQSGLAARERSFQVVPGSSSSWSIELSCCAQADFVCAIRFLRASRPSSPAVSDKRSMMPLATFLASPMMPTLTFLVSPIRSGLMST